MARLNPRASSADTRSTAANQIPDANSARERMMQLVSRPNGACDAQKNQESALDAQLRALGAQIKTNTPEALETYRRLWQSYRDDSRVSSAIERHSEHAKHVAQLQRLFDDIYQNLDPSVTQKDLRSQVHLVQNPPFAWHKELGGLRLYAHFGPSGCSSRRFLTTLRSLGGMQQDVEGTNNARGRNLGFKEAMKLLEEVQQLRRVAKPIHASSLDVEWKPTDCTKAGEMAERRLRMRWPVLRKRRIKSKSATPSTENHEKLGPRQGRDAAVGSRGDTNGGNSTSADKGGNANDHRASHGSALNSIQDEGRDELDNTPIPTKTGQGVNGRDQQRGHRHEQDNDEGCDELDDTGISVEAGRGVDSRDQQQRSRRHEHDDDESSLEFDLEKDGIDDFDFGVDHDQTEDFFKPPDEHYEDDDFFNPQFPHGSIHGDVSSQSRSGRLGFARAEASRDPAFACFENKQPQQQHLKRGDIPNTCTGTNGTDTNNKDTNNADTNNENTNNADTINANINMSATTGNGRKRRREPPVLSPPRPAIPRGTKTGAISQWLESTSASSADDQSSYTNYLNAALSFLSLFTAGATLRQVNGAHVLLVPNRTVLIPPLRSAVPSTDGSDQQPGWLLAEIPDDAETEGQVPTGTLYMSAAAIESANTDATSRLLRETLGGPVDWERSPYPPYSDVCDSSSSRIYDSGFLQSIALNVCLVTDQELPSDLLLWTWQGALAVIDTTTCRTSEVRRAVELPNISTFSEPDFTGCSNGPGALTRGLDACREELTILRSHTATTTRYEEQLKLLHRCLLRGMGSVPDPSSGSNVERLDRQIAKCIEARDAFEQSECEWTEYDVKVRELQDKKKRAQTSKAKELETWIALSRQVAEQDRLWAERDKEKLLTRIKECIEAAQSIVQHEEQVRA